MTREQQDTERSVKKKFVQKCRKIPSDCWLCNNVGEYRTDRCDASVFSFSAKLNLQYEGFTNVALPTSFDKILSVMRSRNMFVTIILQNMAQLKALFEKEWESIAGNCDSFLYLGGNERSTHEYVSKMLGKETINSNTFG
ncbi:MAG: TraM recognition domain-containing protein, partial [Oscillospiraceae bacterium]|nr:TraM recognition domain-containing protein [Oscillospiraceae bacterium]